MNIIPRVNHFTSIFPYEIVQEIFFLCRTSPEWGRPECASKHHPPSTNVPLLLSHVCKTWRSIVHATPALWTDVCIHGRSLHPELLKHILCYSKALPITACIAIIGYGKKYAGRLDTCMKALFCHSARIRSFRLVIKDYHSLWGKCVPIPSFPRLEELMIRLKNCEDPSARLDFFLDSPQLQKLTWLSEYPFPEPLLQLGAQIKELSIRGITPSFTIFPYRNFAPPLALNKYSVLSHLTDS
ncbi:hypothetical protein BJ138DRAFT_1165971 [Hygrophoropsis aurantiaca]|uniref:Uncharacterized protein n=1 Tax=Hygrophoropsis aurantiaca TaxID=72124 RepID=A0ACB7ZUN1_9AGAM|nr:hypothetical protein BJ138DRAFT_1165971 [Hygrophoropsis aurantiaca]